MFWWEDGFNPEEKKGNDTNKIRIKADDMGENFLLHRIENSACQLCGLITPDNLTAVVLGDAGRVNSAITFYDLETGIVKKRVHVENRSGFMALSDDGEVLAVGVLKTDKIMIFHVESGDFLALLEGSRGLGFFGQLQFLKGSINQLVEFRVTEMHKSTPKKSLIRLWDLGFRTHPSSGERIAKDGTSLPESNQDKDQIQVNENENDDEDEVSVKCWEKVIEGNGSYVIKEVNVKSQIEENSAPTSNSQGVFLNIEKQAMIDFMSLRDGSSIRQWSCPLPPKLRETASNSSTSTKKKSSVASSDSWGSKLVVSSSGEYIAVGHFGRCSVMNSLTGELIGEVFSPIENDTYPMIPLGFVGPEESQLVCRINFDRVLVIGSWKFLEISSDSSSITTNNNITIPGKTNKTVSGKSTGSSKVSNSNTAGSKVASAATATMISLNHKRKVAASFVIRDVGGTISDACALSRDGKYLICWPYGFLEIYSLNAMMTAASRKSRRAIKLELIKLRSLREQGRASRKEENGVDRKSRDDSMIQSFVEMDNSNIFQYTLSFL